MGCNNSRVAPKAKAEAAEADESEAYNLEAVAKAMVAIMASRVWTTSAFTSRPPTKS